MKWKLELPEAKVFVYYFSKLAGLAPFVLKEDRFCPPTLLMGKIYPFFLGATYFFALPIALIPMIAKVEPSNFSRLGNIGIMIRHFINMATMLSTLIIFSFMYKEILYILNKLRTISDELIILGINEDSGKFFKNIFFTVTTTNVVLFAICVMLSFVFPYWSIIFSIKYAIDSCFKLNMVLIFAEMLLFIRQRFTMINKILYDVFRPVGLHNSLIFVVSRNPRKETQAKIEDLTDLQRVLKIEVLHLDLCDLVVRMTRLFSIPLLCLSLLYSTELMLISYRLYFVFCNNNVKIVSILMYILGPVLRMVIMSVQLLLLAYASVTTCREGNATKAVLFRVWDRSKSPDPESEFSMFSLQLLHTPVAVSVFGFFDLDYSYLYKIFCVVVAYLIIMIQFDTPRPIFGT